MITDREMQELLHYQPEHQILSVYPNTDPVLGMLISTGFNYAAC